MIATLTCNPSLDHLIRLDALALGEVNRAGAEWFRPGGKGINVSIVLKRLGWESVALGFIAGFSGEELARSLSRDYGLQQDFIRLPEGLTRINVKLRAVVPSATEGSGLRSEAGPAGTPPGDGSAARCETEINGGGPQIPPQALEALRGKLSRLGPGDHLVLSGSAPASVPRDFYAQIVGELSPRGVAVTVDAEGELLASALRKGPFLIKPNQRELSDLLGWERQAVTREEAVPLAEQLRERGARNVLVSLAGEGAVLVDENGTVHRAKAPKGRVVDSVGAGDAMLAGFLAGFLETGSYPEALRRAVAAGSAGAFSEGLADRRGAEALLAHVELY